MENDYAGMSPYNYAFNNPVIFNDPSGNQPEKEEAKPGSADNPIKLDEVTIFEHNDLILPDNLQAQNDPGVQLMLDELDNATFMVDPSGKLIQYDKNAFGTFREISDKEFYGYNWWHSAKEANAEIAIPVNLIDAVLNPFWKQAQQFASDFTGQQFVTNLDGTRAWSTTYSSNADLDAKVLNFAEVGITLATLGFGKAATATNTVVERGTNLVYQGFDKAGVVRYVGITERTAAVRFGEHLSSGTAKSLLQYRVLDGATGLTRTQARVWEQTLINQYGLQKSGGLLINKINSIAPKYWWQYGIK